MRTRPIRIGGNSEDACHRAGWATRLLAVINATWPHPDHAYINLGHPGESRRGCGVRFVSQPSVRGQLALRTRRQAR